MRITTTCKDLLNKGTAKPNLGSTSADITEHQQTREVEGAEHKFFMDTII
jgi:hypothetical protein